MLRNKTIMMDGVSTKIIELGAVPGRVHEEKFGNKDATAYLVVKGDGYGSDQIWIAIYQLNINEVATAFSHGEDIQPESIWEMETLGAVLQFINGEV